MTAEGGGDDSSNSPSSFVAARVACQHSPDLRRARVGLQVEMQKDHPMIPTHTPEPPSGSLGALKRDIPILGERRSQLRNKRQSFTS